MEGFQVRRFGIEIMNGSTSQRFSKKCNGSFRNRNFRTISRGRTTKLTYYIYIYIENQLKWKEVSHHIVLEGSHQIDFMINVLCVYSLKSVHVFFSWSSQRWFRISDSFFPRMFVGTCLTSPGSSPQKIYKPLKENTHHKSFLAVISWKNVDMFLFFCCQQNYRVFFVWFLFYIFLVHTRFKYGRIFQHILLPRNPTFPFQPTGGGKASKAQWCKQGWTLNITSKGFSFWNKNPMVS